MQCVATKLTKKMSVALELLLLKFIEYIIASLFGFIWDSAMPMFCKREEVFQNQKYSSEVAMVMLNVALLCTNASSCESCSS
ncbi:hypothetical protein POTOM_057805 [Populus tomentosa]|uniref:Uncharacterized protein n=1 Tax=Populus tomentosa TaxID=118781 RepID=A0A8X7XWM8_POPTO|nr:hypothetical protein POTOM_057805 [Populus tomentosa]